MTSIKQSPHSPEYVCQVFSHQITGTHRPQQYDECVDDDDVQHFLRSLPKSLPSHELDKLKSHCEDVIRERG